MNKIEVKCDNPGCDWHILKADWREWYNKPCPKCGYAPIINDQEKRMLEFAESVNFLEPICKVIDFIFGTKFAVRRTVQTTRLNPQTSKFEFVKEDSNETKSTNYIA